MSTVSFQLLVKDEYENAGDLILSGAKYCDEVNVTVSDKKTFEKLAKFFSAYKTVNIKYRKWNNRFDEARNENFAMSNSDYSFWLDADDSFDFSTITEMVDMADKASIDAIFLPYNYAQDENGNCITRQYRERLLRNASGFTWKGWIHETPIWPSTDYVSHILDAPEVTHIATHEHLQESQVRNHAILAEAFEQTDDPRYAMYFGMSLFTQGLYAESIKVLGEYLKVSGSPEDIYRSLSMISEAAYHLQKYDIALEYAAKAATLKPAYPMAFWLLAQYEADQKNWKEALEWVKVSLTKPEPRTLSVWDPQARERSILIAAQADFMLGNYNEALKWLRQIPDNPSAKDLMEGFLDEADAETFVNLLPRVRHFFKSDAALWEALCTDIQYDTRIQTLRNSVTTPKIWGDKSIVVFCGEGYEEWGPHTLDKGMGGSEEAVIYLYRELSKLGYEVTVYNEVPHPTVDTTADPQEYKVTYLPWKQFDKRDDFNVFVAWRAPQFLDFVNAKVKLADIHDVIPENVVKPRDAVYMFKSEYQRDLYPNLPKDQSVVVGNGIVKEQFKETK